MSQLHEALECLRPKDFADVPVDDLESFLPQIFAKAEYIANSVPPPPNGTPYESSQRSRSDVNGARNAAGLTISSARRPSIKEQEHLHKAWGKPLKLGSKEAATGISVFKMAGHDRHGAWFARTSVHEGLGFAKWKKAMTREFAESLEVQGAPGEGNVRGIGGDRRLEDVHVKGVGKLEVYQLSAQFPGPTAPREFITLLLTSDSCLSDASKVGKVIPRHYMVVSIPVSHADAPPRNGMVRGYYESVEMIREIPLATSQKASASTSDLLPHDHKKSRERGGTIGFAESRGPHAKGEKIDRIDDADVADPETNPVEWIMITRSDPGGGIPRFMVERNTPASIVQDAAKFLDWACAKEDFSHRGEDKEQIIEEASRQSIDGDQRLSIAEGKGLLAGVGTSIVDRPTPVRQHSQRTVKEQSDKPETEQSAIDTTDPSILHAANSLRRIDSQSSTDTTSSVDSWASAEQYRTAPEGLLGDDTPSTASASASNHSIVLHGADSGHSGHSHLDRELQKLDQKRLQLHENLEQAREKQRQEIQDASQKSAKELEKAKAKHDRSRKKQEKRFEKEVQKLEARRERETKKLLARQQKETERTTLRKAQCERDEYKKRAELAEQELRLLKEQIGELQKENTALVARMGKTETGQEVLRRVREELGEKKTRNRTGSRSSTESVASKVSGLGKPEWKHGHHRDGSGLANVESLQG